MSWSPEFNLAAVVLVVLCGLLAIVGGGLATKAVFRLADRRDGVAPTAQTGEAAPAEDAVENGSNTSDEHSIAPGPKDGPLVQAGDVLRGGLWIGMLERLAVFAALVGGWREAITVVLAVKALGRYPELRNGETPAVAERFIIGTFVSVLWACGCAGLVAWLR